MAEMRYVRQEHEYTCGIAALAMLLDKTYAETLADFEPGVHESRGINELHVQEYLYRHRFAYQKLCRHYQLNQKNMQRETWPAPPWAPRHICMVTTTRGGHFCVMEANGTVLDPGDPARKSLRDYKDVIWIMGVYRVR